MKNIKIEEIQNEVEKLYENLQTAYEEAGNLRDTFTCCGKNEGQLKEHCNIIRGKIYELRQLRGNFQFLIRNINL